MPIPPTAKAKGILGIKTMKIEFDKKNKKDPKGKIIMGVIGVIAIALVIGIGGKFVGGKNPSDNLTNEEVLAEENGEEAPKGGEETSEDVTDEKPLKNDGDPTENERFGEDVTDQLAEEEKHGLVIADENDDKRFGVEDLTIEDDGSEVETVTVKQYKLGDTAKIGKYEITVNSAKKVKDEDGKDAVVIDYNLKNKRFKSEDWDKAIFSHAEQDQSELSRANIKGANDIGEIKGLRTKKGAKEAFLINNNNEIFLEITELSTDKYERALFTFDAPK